MQTGEEVEGRREIEGKERREGRRTRKENLKFNVFIKLL
jgi:hypothetical protein